MQDGTPTALVDLHRIEFHLCEEGNVLLKVCSPFLHADTCIQVEADREAQFVAKFHQTSKVREAQLVHHRLAGFLVVKRALTLAAVVDRARDVGGAVRIRPLGCGAVALLPAVVLVVGLVRSNGRIKSELVCICTCRCRDNPLTSPALE